MKKEEKKSVHLRWNDTSGVSIIHRATNEERKKATDEMVDIAIRNIEKFIDNERKNKK